MKKILLLLFTVCMFASCSDSDHETPPGLDNNGNNGGGGDTIAASSKEIMLWFDAEANFQRFSDQDAIKLFLDKTKETGFNKIVVDVKPVEGDCLYESNILTKATTIGSVTVNRSWDYLQFFIEEAHKRGLKVSVSTTVFAAGLIAYRQGPAYRGTKWDNKTCLEYTPGGMIDIKNDATKGTVFLNPVLPEVQSFALSFIKEIVKNYDLDAFSLDYCRFPDYQSDFSTASKTAFESYIGETVTNWPQDIFTYNTSGGRVAGKYYKQWWEFRAKVISDFISDVKDAIKAIKPNVKLEYWAASWWGSIYQNGQNWASTSYEPSLDPDYYSLYYNTWCSNNYRTTGFAGHIDTFLLGAYLSKIYGASDAESIEYAIARAKRMIGNACTFYGTVQCADPSFNIEEASYYCLKNTAGLMIFDIVHVINNSKWDAIKRGIERALK